MSKASEVKLKQNVGAPMIRVTAATSTATRDFRYRSNGLPRRTRRAT